MVLTALIALLAAPAAQGSPPPADPLMQADGNGDGILTRAEVIANAELGGTPEIVEAQRQSAIRIFDFADSNKNDVLETEERQRAYQVATALPPKPKKGPRVRMPVRSERPVMGPRSEGSDAGNQPND